MSRSLSSLVKRKKTIQKTQKITNAMKLVSMSKSQSYRQKMMIYDPIYQHVLHIPSELEKTDKEPLYIGFVPDLGLASSYMRVFMQTIKALDHPTVLIVGTHNYEEFARGEFCNLLNGKISSENITPDILIELLTTYISTYHIHVIQATSDIGGSLNFEIIDTQRELEKGYDVIYEPSYELANQAYQQMFLESVGLKSYYSCKVSEYLIRQIAMETATDNANQMLEELNLQYNRLRQEKITEEIADLTQAEDEA